MLQGKAAGMDVSIMLDLDGHVTEGPGFNVFVVKGGKLVSPPEGILMGITRQTVFELAAEHKLPAREAHLSAYASERRINVPIAGPARCGQRWPS